MATPADFLLGAYGLTDPDLNLNSDSDSDPDPDLDLDLDFGTALNEFVAAVRRGASQPVPRIEWDADAPRPDREAQNEPRLDLATAMTAGPVPDGAGGGAARDSSSDSSSDSESDGGTSSWKNDYALIVAGAAGWGADPPIGDAYSDLIIYGAAADDDGEPACGFYPEVPTFREVVSPGADPN